MKTNFPSQAKRKIHFIGIGGIGVSALAGYYLSRGCQISGSDLSFSPTTDALRKQGALIFIGPHKAESVKKGVDLVVHTAATTKDNPELKQAKKLGIKTQLYAEALGELTKKMFTIAVSGMHGKSTTTAMLALVLEKAGLDPTVIVGTKLREWNNMNYRVGKGPSTELGASKYLVIEADEYNASFLNYWPKIIILTNIEEEHLDFYKGGLKEIMKTFKKYVSHLGKDGILVANGEDLNISKIKNQKSKIQCKIILYSSSESAGRRRNREVNIKKFSTSSNNKLKLKIPGKHNVSNAMAVLEVAKILKIPQKKAIETLNNFQGTWRRMEYRGKINGAKIYDDYGHHPTEIKATLEGAHSLLFERPASWRGVENLLKNFSTSSKNKIRRLYCVFQPHQYQRTYKLFNQFLTAFDFADKAIILPIYSVPGREKESIKKKVSSEKLVEEIKHSLRHAPLSGACSGNKKVFPERSDQRDRNRRVLYIDSFIKTKNYLKRNLRKGDVCVIMGAGDIYKLTEILLA